MKFLFCFIAAACLLATATAGPVITRSSTSLESWQPENFWFDSGEHVFASWELSADKTSVFEKHNSEPSVFFHNTNAVGTTIHVTTEVQTASDDDFVGFVLGFQAGEANNPNQANIDYLLLDWKQDDQAWKNGFGSKGLGLARVSGKIDHAQIWGHCTGKIPPSCTSGDTAGNMKELARGFTRGSTGWSDNTIHNWEITYTTNRLIVKIDGTLEFDYSPSSAEGAFPAGLLGFYAFSQKQAAFAMKDVIYTFNGFQNQVTAGEVPVTVDSGATYNVVWNYGDGTPDTAGSISNGKLVGANTFRAEGVYDATVTVTDTNTSATDTIAVKFIIAPAGAPGDGGGAGNQCETKFANYDSNTGNIAKITVQKAGKCACLGWN